MGPGSFESNFYSWEAEMVSKIHVSEAWAEDILIWPLTSNGDYSVRSAYRMLVADEENTNLSSSSLDSSQSVWKKIWKIWAPNKICYFIWHQQKTPFPQSKIWNLDIFWWMKHALSMMIIRKLLCIIFGYVIMLRQCGSQILDSTFCVKNSTGLLWILWKSCSKTARVFRLLCFLLLLGVYGSGNIVRENTNLHGCFMRLVPELRIWLWSISTYINKLPEWMHIVPRNIGALLLSTVTKLILMQLFLRTRVALVLGWYIEIMKGMSL